MASKHSSQNLENYYENSEEEIHLQNEYLYDQTPSPANDFKNPESFIDQNHTHYKKNAPEDSKPRASHKKSQEIDLSFTSDQLNQFLQVNQSYLTKKMFRIIIEKIQKRILALQNEDARTRSSISKIKRKYESVHTKISNEERNLNTLKKNEKKDKNYIEMQMYEITNQKTILMKNQALLNKTTKTSSNNEYSSIDLQTLKKQTTEMENMLTNENQIIKYYDEVLKIIDEKKYSQSFLLKISNKLALGNSGEIIVSKSKMTKFLEQHSKL